MAFEKILMVGLLLIPLILFLLAFGDDASSQIFSEESQALDGSEEILHRSFD